MRKTFWALIILIVLMLVAGFLMQIRQSRLISDRVPVASGAISMDGTFICLPHRDTEGPHTMECALGLAGDDGNNYSLDLNATGFDALGNIGTGERMRIEGTVTPVEALSTDTWWKYDMAGIITVRTLTKL